MTDQTETESEYESVAATLEKLAHGDGPADPLGDGARAIRALEASVRDEQQRVQFLEAERANADVDYEQLRADRDRRAGEVEKYRREWHLMELERDTLRDVRDRTCAEVARLTSELAAAARENEARYLWLRDRADYHQRRTILNDASPGIDAAIDAARSAAGEEG